MKWKIILSILLLSTIVFGFQSPKSLSGLVALINQSGTVISDGNVNDITLKIYIPKNRISVYSSHNFSIKKDKWGNEYAVLYLGNGGSYWITTLTKSEAHYIGQWKPVHSSSWIGNSSHVVISEPIRKIASSFEFDSDSIASMVSSVNSIMTYDPELFEYNMPSDWVLENKRGTCDEYSNLLIALLRSMGIPSRAVVGYAYSSPGDNVIRPHSWVEVLTNRGWVEADPTWNELGYIDAAHIRIGSFPDTVAEDSIEYKGTGKVRWKKNKDIITMVKQEYSSPVRVSVFFHPGYAELFLTSNGCMIYKPHVSKCINHGKPAMLSYTPSSYICNSGENIVFFIPVQYGGLCPVSIYDDYGNKAEQDIPMKHEPGPSIIAPEKATAGQKLYISTNPPSVFYASGMHFGATNVTFRWPGKQRIFAVNRSTSSSEIEILPSSGLSVYVYAPEVSHGENATAKVVIFSDRRRNGMLTAISGSRWEKIVNVSKGANTFYVPFLANTSTLKVFFNSDISASNSFRIKYKKPFLSWLLEQLNNFILSILE